MINKELLEALKEYVRNDDAPLPLNGIKTKALAAIARAEAAQAERVEPVGQPYGIVDPDYARVFTQARIVAWQYGYACVMHGSFTRDLDLLLVPWTEQARDNYDQLLKLIAQGCGLRFADGKEDVVYSKVDFTDKPHGRKSCSLYFPQFGDRRWIDISISPVTPPAAVSEPEQLKLRIRIHLANRDYYSHKEFCEKLEQILYEVAPPAAVPQWMPIGSAPKDRFVLLACPSGYTTTPLVFTTGIMHSDYKQGRWVDHANDNLTDWGMEPTHWMPLPPAPSGANE